MHYRMEVLMPPTDDVDKVLEVALKGFSEHDEENNTPFYDYYVVGGRYSGDHNLDGLDKVELEKFYKELNEAKITVSGVQFGKQTLSPQSQIPLVESIWAKYFPGQCPVFDNYIGGGDIITWGEAKVKDITCYRFLVLNKDHSPRFMTQGYFWNDVTRVKSNWDGTVKAAFAEFVEETKHYKEDYRLENAPKDDWLLVTVDYHN